MTTSVLELFISFLRPTGANVGEENFDLAERLSQIADSNENLDDSLNVMMNTFETNMRFLQSVGHLIQWMATHIISQVTQLRSHALCKNLTTKFIFNTCGEHEQLVVDLDFYKSG